MAEPLSTNVTIEPCLEPSVHEYALSGEKTKSYVKNFHLSRFDRSIFRTQSMSEHFTKILSRMDLNDLRSEDSVDNSNEDERRTVNGNKNAFGTFFEQMR